MTSPSTLAPSPESWWVSDDCHPRQVVSVDERFAELAPAEEAATPVAREHDPRFD